MITGPVDLTQLHIALNEAQRQAIQNLEHFDRKAFPERAWVIYQAWHTVLASEPAKTPKGSEVEGFSSSDLSGETALEP